MPPGSNSLKRLPLLVDLKRFHVQCAHYPGSIPDDYPFQLDPDRSTMVPFFEWRGRDAPPEDIGYSGDVYLDLTPDHFALYAYVFHTSTQGVESSINIHRMPQTCTLKSARTASPFWRNYLELSSQNHFIYPKEHL
jgi:hypothetical protein